MRAALSRLDDVCGDELFGHVVSASVGGSCARLCRHPLVYRVKLCALPASTLTMLPVDFADMSETKKKAASAMSSGIDAELQQRALAVMLLQLVRAHLVGGGALLAPFAGPDLGAAQHRVGVDRVDADAELRAFQRQAAGEMDLGGLGGAVGGGVGRGGEPVLGGDEDDGAAGLLLLHQPEGLARDQEIAGRQDVHVAVPHRQLGLLDRRRRGDAGIGDQNVDAAIFGRREGEGVDDVLLPA